MNELVQEMYPEHMRLGEGEEISTTCVPMLALDGSVLLKDANLDGTINKPRARSESSTPEIEAACHIPSPPLSRRDATRKFRLSRSPLDSLQAEFRKYSMPERHIRLERKGSSDLLVDVLVSAAYILCIPSAPFYLSIASWYQKAHAQNHASHCPLVS